MRTTALLTLTGTGTVIREWLNQLAAGSVATPELVLLGAAILGLGLQTLRSHHIEVCGTRSPALRSAAPPLGAASTSA